MPGLLSNLIRKNMQSAPASNPAESAWMRPRLRSWFEPDSPAAASGFGPSAVERDAGEESNSPGVVDAPTQDYEPFAGMQRLHALDSALRSHSLSPQQTHQSNHPSPAATRGNPTPAILTRRTPRVTLSLPSVARVAALQSPVESNVATPRTSTRSASPASPSSGEAGARAPAVEMRLTASPPDDMPPRPSRGEPQIPMSITPVSGSLIDQDSAPLSGTLPGNSPRPDQSAPTIRVTIGRIEVRAAQPGGNAPAGPTPAKSQPQSSRAIPALSLADYLERRSRARSRGGG